MPDLKLPKLPDRTPVKITIVVSPQLNQALSQYADMYRATYGETESVAELIPFMLGAFPDGAGPFAKPGKEAAFRVPPDQNRRRRGQRTSLPPTAITRSEE